MKTKLEKFRERVKEARKLMSFGEFSIYTEISVQIGISVFHLNPFLINLHTMSYEGKSRDLFTGRKKKVNLKELKKQEKEK